MTDTALPNLARDFDGDVILPTRTTFTADFINPVRQRDRIRTSDLPIRGVVGELTNEIIETIRELVSRGYNQEEQLRTIYLALQELHTEGRIPILPSIEDVRIIQDKEHEREREHTRRVVEWRANRNISHRTEYFQSHFSPLVQASPELGLEAGRPLLAELRRRSSVDWGLPPHYNEEYKSLRWPSNGLGEQPVWLQLLKEDIRKKSAGDWNNTRFGMRFTRGGYNNKNNTRTRLFYDLRNCMRQNIPFKTPSIEYRPADTSIYIYGIKRITYYLYSGHIDSFTYGGHYNKFVSLFFREMSINVFKRDGRIYEDLNAPVVFTRNLNERRIRSPDVEIDINRTYTLPLQPRYLISNCLNEERLARVEYVRNRAMAEQQNAQTQG